MTNASNAARALNALANSTRRAVFERVAASPAAVGEIARGMPVSRPAVSQHLRVLKEAGLVTETARGTRRIYRIDPGGIGAVRDWLDRHWERSLDAFKAYAESLPPEETPRMTVAPIVRTVQVAVSPQRAFDLFAGHMGRWWHEGHHIGAKPFADIVIEPGPGGRWYERDADGGETLWGKVLDWDPPHRLLLGWQLNAEFKYDPKLLTELELTFEPAEGGTQVTLTHRNLERFGDAAARLGLAMGDGWGMLLGLYRDFGNEEKTA